MDVFIIIIIIIIIIITNIIFISIIIFIFIINIILISSIIILMLIIIISIIIIIIIMIIFIIIHPARLCGFKLTGTIQGGLSGGCNVSEYVTARELSFVKRAVAGVNFAFMADTMTSWNGKIFRVTGHLCHKGQWRGALMFSLICAWINGWVNNGETGNLKRHRAHYDVFQWSLLYFTSLHIWNWCGLTLIFYAKQLEILYNFHVTRYFNNIVM